MYSFRSWIVSALTFQHIIHFEFIFGHSTRHGSKFIFYMRISNCLSMTCWKDCFFPSWNCPGTFVKDQLTINVRIYFWTPSHFPMIYIAYFFPNATLFWLLYHCSKFWNWKYNSSIFIIFSKMVLAIFHPLHFNINFRNSLTVTAEQPADILIEITLNL